MPPANIQLIQHILIRTQIVLQISLQDQIEGASGETLKAVKVWASVPITEAFFRLSLERGGVGGGD